MSSSYLACLGAASRDMSHTGTPPNSVVTAATSLTVPAAAWPAPPAHDISTIGATPHARAAIVTGSTSGQLCLWAIDATGASASEGAAAAASSADSAGSAGELLNLVPRVILLGHTAPVVWTACCLFERSDALVSLCAAGLLNVWDPSDGRCLSSASAPLLPVATIGAVLPQLAHAVVGGESLNLAIVHLSTMTVRCVLTPLDDWCAPPAALRPRRADRDSPAHPPRSRRAPRAMPCALRRAPTGASLWPRSGPWTSARRSSASMGAAACARGC